MWTTIITALLPLAIKLLMNYFDKVDDDRADKKAFIGFIEAINKTSGHSAKMKVAAKTARERLKQRKAELNQ